MRRLAAALGATTAAACASVALAASLVVGTSQVGAGTTAIAACDGDGFTYTFTTSGGGVTDVTVADLADPGCEGGVLQATLVDSGGAALATGGPTTVPSDGDAAPNSVTLSTSSAPLATQVAGIRASVTGP